MSNIKHLVPLADRELEAVISNPMGLAAVVSWLKEKGVKWDEPKGAPLTESELRTVVRIIYRELRFRDEPKEEAAK